MHWTIGPQFIDTVVHTVLCETILAQTKPVFVIDDPLSSCLQRIVHFDDDDDIVSAFGDASVVKSFISSDGYHGMVSESRVPALCHWSL